MLPLWHLREEKAIFIPAALVGRPRSRQVVFWACSSQRNWSQNLRKAF